MNQSVKFILRRVPGGVEVQTGARKAVWTPDGDPHPWRTVVLTRLDEKCQELHRTTESEEMEKIRAELDELRAEIVRANQDRASALCQRDENAKLRAENADLRAQINMEKSKRRRQRTADLEPTVIEGWTIHVSSQERGFAINDHVKCYCRAHDDGTCDWSPRGLAEVPDRARLEVEYQLLAARARFEGWAWGVFPYGHGLWFARVKELWMYGGKGNPGIGDTPPAYIRALAERAERRIAG